MIKRFEGDKAEWYEERAAIMEYDGKMKREQAEQKAAMIANRLWPETLSDAPESTDQEKCIG